MEFPACSKCHTLLPATAINPGRFAPCPGCGAEIWVEVFPALGRPLARGSGAETVMMTGESACFYHEDKKARIVCDACGRFLCGLCDCELSGKHFCPGCLESGRKKGGIQELENVRSLHGRQALILAILPFFITGLAAIFLAIRYWKTPGSLVKPQRWQLPVALVLAILQTLAFSALILAAFLK